MTTLALPKAPLDRWLEAARVRSSRRSFDGRELAGDTLESIAHALDRSTVDAPARIVLLPQASGSLFRGIIGGYGRITGAPSALVMVGASKGPSAQVSLGYLGEAAILEATALGVGTCWVGGMFDRGAVHTAVPLAQGEVVLAISPLGIPTKNVSSAERLVYRAGKPRPRKPTGEIAPGPEGGAWPTWARPGLEAARIAPSAHNRQPWRFRPEDGAVIVSFDGPETMIVSKRLDCGIAMLHFELAVRAAGTSGAWEILEHRKDVARFTIGPV